jgi:hypothetical protein
MLSSEEKRDSLVPAPVNVESMIDAMTAEISRHTSGDMPPEELRLVAVTLLQEIFDTLRAGDILGRIRQNPDGSIDITYLTQTGPAGGVFHRLLQRVRRK